MFYYSLSWFDFVFILFFLRFVRSMRQLRLCVSSRFMIFLQLRLSNCLSFDRQTVRPHNICFSSIFSSFLHSRIHKINMSSKWRRTDKMFRRILNVENLRKKFVFLSVRDVWRTSENLSTSSTPCHSLRTTKYSLRSTQYTFGCHHILFWFQSPKPANQLKIEKQIFRFDKWKTNFSFHMQREHRRRRARPFQWKPSIQLFMWCLSLLYIWCVDNDSATYDVVRACASKFKILYLFSIVIAIRQRRRRRRQQEQPERKRRKFKMHRSFACLCSGNQPTYVTYACITFAHWMCVCVNVHPKDLCLDFMHCYHRRRRRTALWCRTLKREKER